MGGEILERGEAPLLPTFPLPLLREGGQGDGFLNNVFIRRLDSNWAEMRETGRIFP
jgi:hypothetical protein